MRHRHRQNHCDNIKVIYFYIPFQIFYKKGCSSLFFSLTYYVQKAVYIFVIVLLTYILIMFDGHLLVHVVDHK